MHSEAGLTSACRSRVRGSQAQWRCPKRITNRGAGQSHMGYGRKLSANDNESMSNVNFAFPLWAYFFIPPIILADVLGWLVAPLAVALAAAWLAFWRRWPDIVLLALVLISAAGITWAILAASGAGFVIASSAIFAWLIVILFPLRWIAGRLIRARPQGHS